MCGAASSCRAWRAVARHSRVNNLHLHSMTDGQERCCARLLAARSCIDTLKLTSDRVCNRTNEIYAIHRSDEVADATISSIPTACRSLTLNEFSAYGVDVYIAKSPEVQQLSIQWNGLQAWHSSFHELPSFAALHQLRQLTVHMRNDIFGTSFPSLVESCPDTMESLILEGFGSQVEEQRPPVLAVHSLKLLEDNLPALTRLELAFSVVRIPGNDITCLRTLKSLGLCYSNIYVDGQLEISLLTNLTHLDLNGAICFWEDAWVDALDAFTAWPSLAVFKLYNCNLFDMNTVVDVSTVGEVHVGHTVDYAQPRPDEEGRVRACHIDSTFSYHSKRAATIVDLTVKLDHDPTADSLPGYVAAHCPLQSVILNRASALCCRPTEPLDFPGASFSSLRHLAITGLYPVTHSVDLQSLLCLTSLELVLHSSRESSMKSIMLPLKLEEFSFLGCELFQGEMKHNLNELASLTKIELELDFAGGDCVCLPGLPLSVRHLVLAGTEWNQWDIDWSGLHGCLQHCLQHLTLACCQQMSEQLKMWVRSARCLYVLDQSVDVYHICQVQYPAARLPYVAIHETQGWL